MRKISKTALMVAVAAAATGMFAPAAQAQQTWNVTEAIGSFNWHEDANWTPGPYPNAVGIVANVNNDISTAMNIAMPGGAGATVGILNLGDSGTAPDQKFTLGSAPGGQGTLVFDNGANDAQLNVLKDVTAGGINEADQLGTNLTLNSNLVIDTGPIFASTVLIRGKISDGVNGPKGLTINGTGFAELRSAGEANTFTGLTIINSRLRVLSGGGFDLIAGDVQIQNGGVLQDGFGNGNVISDTSNINVINGRYNNGGGSDTIGSLEGGDLGTVGGGGGTITFGGNGLDKTYNGIFNSEPSLVKTGTGVQTLGGPSASVLPDSSPAGQQFGVLGGRVDLAKPDGVTSIAQRNLNIGDGSQTGALRPEVRLLANEQIQVHLGSGSTETTPVTLNSGILNLAGKTETLGSLTVTQTGANNVATIDLGAGGKLNVASGLTVNAGAVAEVAGDGTSAMKTLGLTVNGQLDMKTNDLVVDYATTSETGNVRTLLTSGRNGGAWNGNGIMSSAITGETALGHGEASDVLGLTAGQTATFSGQTVDDTSVLVKYTYGGDSNLDGKVDNVDLGALAANWQGSGKVWTQADFSYDGLVDNVDLGILAATWQKGVTSGPVLGPSVDGVTAVPEPGSLSLVVLAATTLLGRRRRRMND